MKQLITIFMSFILHANYAQCVSTDPASPCCNELINIDPHNNNTFSSNSERSDINFKAANNLEWVNTSKPNFLHNKTPGTSPLILTNPWVQYVSNLYPYFSNFSISGMKNPVTGLTALYSNMDPRYGWQLLHSSTNYQPYSSSALAATDPGFSNGPYFLFYNKYTGQLRSVIYPEGYEGANSMQFRLGFNTSNSYAINNNSYYTSGLFNSYDRMQALDQRTIIENVYAIADNTQGGGDSRPYIGDFNLSYDPCVCNSLPELEFDIFNRDNLKLYAEGRLVAISSPFNKNGSAPYNFGKDFMSSVHGDYISNVDFSVKNGLLVYNKADQLAKDYFVSPEMQFLSSALGMFGKVVSGGINISTGLTPASLLGDLSLVPSSIRSDTSLIKIPVGNILAGGLNMLSTAINPPTPNVFLIEGQMALRGEITNSISWSGFNTKNIGHPGSPINKTVGKHNYPYYNEAPGLFALLKTPQIDFKINKSNTVWMEPVGGGIFQVHNYRRNTGFDINFTNGALEYALNPAAEIDMEKSKIYATIEYDLYSYARHDEFASPFGGVNLPVNWTYNDFWGIETGKIAQNGIPNTAFESHRNNIYKDYGNLMWSSSSSPNTNYTSNVVYKTNDIISPSFYKVKTDTIYYDSAIQHILLRTQGASTQCSNLMKTTFKILDEDFDDCYHATSPCILNQNWHINLKNKLFRNTIQTTIVPIENISQLDFREIYDHLNYIDFNRDGNCLDIMKSALDPRLKILAHYVFKPNEYGEVNETEQIYTYKINTNVSQIVNSDFSSVSNPSLNDLLSDLTIGTVAYTSPKDIYGKNITINGALSSNGSRIRIYASESVTIIDPGSIDPNIEIIIIDIFNQEKLNPVSSSALASYCNLTSGNYKAKESLNKVLRIDNIFLNKYNFSNKLSLFPNPTKSSTTLKMENPTSNKAVIKAYDMLGREVLSMDALDITEQKNKIELKTENLQNGLYIIKVIHGEVEQSLKLEIQK